MRESQPSTSTKNPATKQSKKHISYSMKYSTTE
jgi:hypothetical protein